MALIDYALTEHQEEVARLYDDGMSSYAIGDQLGKDPGSVRRTIRRMEARAAQKGDDPEHGLNRAVPDGYKLKGFSDMRTNEEGKPIWYKVDQDKERQIELLREACQAIVSDVPPIPPVAPPKDTNDKLIAVIPVADPHIGAYAWAREAGDDFDLEIAERDLCAAIDYLISKAPSAARGVLANLGDWFHATNNEGTTSKSGNVLDMDGRFPKMSEVGVRIKRYMIGRMLEKFGHVDVIVTPGNHDDEMAKMMRVLLLVAYENESRVTIHDNSAQRCYIEFGKFLMGAVHGHQTKDADLPGIMATEVPEAWGRTRCRVFYRGHHHHDSEVEYRGCKVQQVRKLTPADAYETGHGYLSGNDLKLQVFHADRETEQTRITCGLDVARGC